MNGQKVRYNDILLNEGNGYNPNTGVFRASVEGIYVFAVKICSWWQQWDELEIVHDQVVIGRALSGDSAVSSCGTDVATAYLKVGSEVWVARARGTGGAIQRTIYWCSFIGVLVS